jgi:hypothetical protein
MMSIETITSSTTWTCPTGVTSLDVELWGAGGPGGGSASKGGGGGGGGAYSKKTLSVTPGYEYALTIGTDGGNTSFAYGETTLVLAKGGQPGDNGDPGFGGQASECIGEVKHSGGDGGGSDYDAAGGGGGSSAGPEADGNDGGYANGGTPGTGAEAPTGGGDGADGGEIEANGESATEVGGGGGGCGYDGDNGGNGFRGHAKLTYTAATTVDRSKPRVIGLGLGV